MGPSTAEDATYWSEAELLRRHGELRVKLGTDRALAADGVRHNGQRAVFVKIAAHENGVIALRMLAEIYRAARVLWPASAEAAGSSVTIHIGKLRGLKVVDDIATSSYVNGQQWVLVRSSEQEGVVQLDDCEAVLDMVRQGTALTALRFWSSRWDGDLVEPVENSTSMKSSTGGRV